MEYTKDLFEKLRPDVSVATSGRVCCYIGTYQMLRRDVIFAALYFPEKGCHLGTNRSDNET